MDDGVELVGTHAGDVFFFVCGWDMTFLDIRMDGFLLILNLDG